MLRKLKQLWYQRLKDDGFVDIESSEGTIKTYDRRTVSFDNRTAILEFFLQLDRYIAQSQLKPLDRQILLLYGGGMHITDIANALGYTRQWIYQTIRKHKVEMGYAFKPKKVSKTYILRKREPKNT